MTAAGARARVRAELTREIVEAARRHLATDGATGLSLRAVARELGMASSAVYRYFASRHQLLTALILEAYDVLAPGVAEGLGLPEPLAPRVVTAWSSLYGAISFELFGQTHNVVDDHGHYFDAAVERLADLVLLP